MKKGFWNSKRFLSLLLVMALVMGQTGFVSAETVQDDAEGATVSGNAVETVAPEKAYDGTPSKVIGLEGTYTKDNGFQLTWNPLDIVNKITNRAISYSKVYINIDERFI